MQRYKLVFISETFFPDLCGVADYVYILSQQLSTSYEVHVITRAVDEVKYYTLNGVNVHEIMTSKLYALDVVNLLRKLKPDLVDIQLSYSLAANRLNQFNIFSSFISFFIRSTIKTKLVCTIHELTSYLNDGRNSHIRGLYRQFRDYFGTRLFDYYFCVDRSYLEYIKCDRKLFLPNFSNIPSLVHKTKVNSKHFLYFGTIAPHKNIDHLLNLFSNLLQLEPECKLFLVGGLTEGVEQVALQDKLARLPEHAVQYLGRLSIEELTKPLADCSYALFPFLVTDKNASVLAIMVNGLVVIAESDSETIFERYGNTFYKTPQLTPEFIHQVMEQTSDQMLNYKTYDQLLKDHVELRSSVYQSLITSSAK